MTPQQSCGIDRRATLLHVEALDYLLKHQGDHLAPGQPPLLERCISHLAEKCGVSRTSAETAALQALGECNASFHGLYIDCSATTSYALHLVNSKTRQRYVIPLCRLAETLPGIP